MKDITIMVLGAGGFIGSHLCNLCIQNSATVYALGRNLDNVKVVNERLIKLNSNEITEKTLSGVPQPDYVYFLIGAASVAKSIEAPLYDFNQSIPPLLLVLEKLRKEWLGTRFIFISSAAVYGENASESTSIHSFLMPLSPYGLNKKISETYVQYYMKHYGINAKIIRPFSVYGPGLKKQLIWDVLSKIKNKQHHYFGSGNEMRDWIYIDDFISVLCNYVNNYNLMSDLINVGSGVPVKVKDIIGQLYALTDSFETPSFSDGGKEGDPKHLVSSYEEQDFLREFLNTPLELGLKKTVDWFNKIQEVQC
ncbi:NAD-dependent epimerase/dehydratase family protein [Escherichia albertii]|uniref:NAD-dependent epimerase/dehydratase family protein n=1 Tax=Escherichia albertii TaxID=208962 RepID=UPI000CF6DEB0|nr:NAD-dependent epimerase/dehydratase family protein [Escherichia albertii]EJY9801563.1 NAD-dependent epimerase/dehydratase family protein [Escherichia albertii]MCU7328516.1 NAD-dependent epimerase/dehydratase family protein [Escherichia albertii]MCU7337580.1 NAD-dependent epimerase/dehydratase family protein [Escherichia albertii]MCU7341746.1 NAD-dependent epimerase/dehydratase family protein [Escherichia albertii]MCU7346003.1 NAD-dependent epimerase/dehydratase family protein [Escherichia a